MFSSSLTFVVFYILQINCRGKFWGFFLCYSLTHHENPLEIFPYGAPPFPPQENPIPSVVMAWIFSETTYIAPLLH